MENLTWVVCLLQSKSGSCKASFSAVQLILSVYNDGIKDGGTRFVPFAAD